MIKIGLLNYAIKALPVDKLSPNAIGYCIKTIFHLSLLYPYLLQIIDQAVFERFHVPKDQIKAFSEMVYEQELKNKNYDAVCHALIKDGTISDRVFTRDYEFKAPSAASAVILGHTSNGNVDWKTADGTKLKDL